MKVEVHKFGGSSLRDTDRFRAVSELIMEQLAQGADQVGITISAMGNTTDQLNDLATGIFSPEIFESKVEKLIQLHQNIAEDLLNEPRNYTHFLDQSTAELNHYLHTLFKSGTVNTAITDLINGYGELWSSYLIANYLIELGIAVQWYDARDLIRIENLGDHINIDWQSTRIAFDQIDSTTNIIIPGYVCRDSHGTVSTLGRNGSDLSAAILAVLMQADELQIWTDVDGIYSSDPRRVKNAKILDHLSYLEAMEMAYFGARVLHPSSLYPAIEQNIPIRVRNSYNPKRQGTWVGQPRDSEELVKGFATIDDVALITLQGAGMIGVPGISEKLFQALHSADISVIMISQASSEYSISVVIEADDGELGRSVIAEEFAYQIQQGKVNAVVLEENCSVLAVVGDNMVRQPGIASRLFTALSRSRINVRMISQGSSERNISVVVDRQDITKALVAAHSAFYLSHLTISIGIIGIGLIGSSLIDQLAEATANLRDHYNIDLQVNALANSKKMLTKPEIELGSWREELSKNSKKMDLDEFTECVDDDAIPHTVIIDCTSSLKIATCYPSWLDRGIHVITPNKKANSGDFDLYQQLQTYIDKGPTTNPLDKATHYFYETTVGAGLPIISTLRDLIKTGDQIKRIEGVFSGTLSYIFNSLSEENSFSSIVKRARDLGYTEPDPRDDLSGRDVARKVIILARELGYQVSIEQLNIESLIPKELPASLSVDDFLAELDQYDGAIKTRIQEATDRGKVLRYVGIIDEKGNCKVGIEEFDRNHPFANLNGSENIISYTTNRYNTYPLIVRGPGAGAEVTSAGIFADLIRLAELLGAA